VNSFKLALTMVLLKVRKDEKIDHAGRQTIPSDSNTLTKKVFMHFEPTLVYNSETLCSTELLVPSLVK